MLLEVHVVVRRDEGTRPARFTSSSCVLDVCIQGMQTRRARTPALWPYLLIPTSKKSTRARADAASGYKPRSSLICCSRCSACSVKVV